MVACEEPVSLPKWFEERQIKHLSENIKYKKNHLHYFPPLKIRGKVQLFHIISVSYSKAQKIVRATQVKQEGMENGREAGWEAKKKKEKAKRGTEEIPKYIL